MWVDDGGGTDATTDTASPDGMSVTVDGQEYTADVNFDINEDGVEDTAVVEGADGTAQAFVDADGDGAADQYIQLDAEGNVLSHAQYDAASGDWVAAEPGGTGGTTESTESETSSGGAITADLPSGDVEVGQATVDTNNDGINDTAVMQDESGNTIGFTDVDGDGQADSAVIIDPSGHATVYEHTGDGQWTETGGESSYAPADGQPPDSDAAWGGDGTDTVEGVAKIDSSTGQWMSPN